MSQPEKFSLSDLVKSQAKYQPEVAELLPMLAAPPSQDLMPLYIEDLQERARRQNKSEAEIREQDRSLLAAAQYPTPACLKAAEMLLLVSNSAALETPRREHYQACVYCQALAATSRPNEALVISMAQRLAEPFDAPETVPTPGLVDWLVGLLRSFRPRAAVASFAVVALLVTVIVVNQVRQHQTIATAWSFVAVDKEMQSASDPAKVEFLYPSSLVQTLASKSPSPLVNLAQDTANKEEQKKLVELLWRTGLNRMQNGASTKALQVTIDGLQEVPLGNASLAAHDLQGRLQLQARSVEAAVWDLSTTLPAPSRVSAQVPFEAKE